MDPHGVPEVFADFTQIAISDLGVFVGFLSASPLSQGAIESASEEGAVKNLPIAMKAVVRFDPVGAKTFAILIKRALKAHESQFGEITLPPEVVQQSDVSPDEW